jgi:hypothetical protein
MNELDESLKTKAKEVSKIKKFGLAKWLRKDIGDILGAWYMSNNDVASLDAFTNPVVVPVNMPHRRLMLWVLRHLNR